MFPITPPRLKNVGAQIAKQLMLPTNENSERLHSSKDRICGFYPLDPGSNPGGATKAP